MVQVDETTQGVLNQISEGFEQKGAYNLRQNGIPLCHGDSEHIKIRKKEDKPGIDILIDGETKGEKVFIPVVVSVSGMTACEPNHSISSNVRSEVTLFFTTRAKSPIFVTFLSCKSCSIIAFKSDCCVLMRPRSPSA